MSRQRVLSRPARSLSHGGCVHVRASSEADGKACARAPRRPSACVCPVGAASPRHPAARVTSARLCAVRATEATACSYPVRVHLHCGAAHALPCCHDETRYLQGKGITHIPPQTFDKNIRLVDLYVPAGLRGRPWRSVDLPCPPPSSTESQVAVHSRRQDPCACAEATLCVCAFLWVRPKTFC